MKKLQDWFQRNLRRRATLPPQRGSRPPSALERGSSISAEDPEELLAQDIAKLDLQRALVHHLEWCVVFNDRGLGNERAFQNELYGGRNFAVDYGDVDFAALARVLGAHGERVEQPAALLPALKRALASGRPAVVDVIIDRNLLAPVVYKP